MDVEGIINALTSARPSRVLVRRDRHDLPSAKEESTWSPAKKCLTRKVERTFVGRAETPLHEDFGGSKAEDITPSKDRRKTSQWQSSDADSLRRIRRGRHIAMQLTRFTNWALEKPTSRQALRKAPTAKQASRSSWWISGKWRSSLEIGKLRHRA